MPAPAAHQWRNKCDPAALTGQKQPPEKILSLTSLQNMCLSQMHLSAKFWGFSPHWL